MASPWQKLVSLRRTVAVNASTNSPDATLTLYAGAKGQKYELCFRKCGRLNVVGKAVEELTVVAGAFGIVGTVPHLRHYHLCSSCRKTRRVVPTRGSLTCTTKSLCCASTLRSESDKRRKQPQPRGARESLRFVRNVAMASMYLGATEPATPMWPRQQGETRRHRSGSSRVFAVSSSQQCYSCTPYLALRNDTGHAIIGILRSKRWPWRHWIPHCPNQVGWPVYEALKRPDTDPWLCLPVSATQCEYWLELVLCWLS